MTSTPISLRAVVFDCPDPSGLASFYADLLNGSLNTSDPEWCEVHVGDPAFDLGFSLTHLLSKGHHLKEHRSAFLAAAVTYWKTYETETGSTAWFSGVESRAVNNTIACLLARTSGRSPLEYLSDDERARQKGAALHLISHHPDTIPALVEDFERRIER